MTPIEVLFEQLITINIWLIVKLVVLFALGLYLVFAAMVIREVDLMNRTITGTFNLPIKIVAIIHLLLAILVFVLAVVIL
jgi:hypothetical protein